MCLWHTCRCILKSEHRKGAAITETDEVEQFNFSHHLAFAKPLFNFLSFLLTTTVHPWAKCNSYMTFCCLFPVFCVDQCSQSKAGQHLKAVQWSNCFAQTPSLPHSLRFHSFKILFKNSFIHSFERKSIGDFSSFLCSRHVFLLTAEVWSWHETCIHISQSDCWVFGELQWHG